MNKKLTYLLEHFEEEMNQFSIENKHTNFRRFPFIVGGICAAGSVCVAGTSLSSDKTKETKSGGLLGGLLTNQTLSEHTNELKNVMTDFPEFPDEKKAFYQKILEICNANGLDEVEVYKKANLSRSIFSKIRTMDKTDYLPSKSTVICICLSLGLNLPETQNLLSYVGYSLSNKMLVDKIIAWAITHQVFDIFDIDYCIHDRTGKSYLLQ